MHCLKQGHPFETKEPIQSSLLSFVLFFFCFFFNTEGRFHSPIGRKLISEGWENQSWDLFYDVMCYHFHYNTNSVPIFISNVSKKFGY